MSRRGPRAGYDFTAKRDYRRKVWATFRDSLKNRDICLADSHALLMPSSEGDEIEVALNAGFREWNLHVVDMNPAIVATLRRRYPKINTYGVRVSKAMSRLQTQGVKIRCMNLDFCGQWSLAYARELCQIAAFGFTQSKYRDDGQIHIDGYVQDGGVFEDLSFVSISILRGREAKGMITEVRGYTSEQARRLIRNKGGSVDPMSVPTTRALLEIWNGLTPYDRARLMQMMRCLSLDFWKEDIERRAGCSDVTPHAMPIRVGSYLSASGQTMLWSVLEIHSFRETYRVWQAANKARLQLGQTPRPWGSLV